MVIIRNTAIILLFILTAMILIANPAEVTVNLEISENEYDIVEVIRGVDGDTIEVMLDGEKEKVRLLGVDTAESVHPTKKVEAGSLEASAFTKFLVGKQVILTYDEKKRGYYGRLLAYVWLPYSDNGVLKTLCWNLELIRQGHSELYTKYDFGLESYFRERVGGK